MNLSDIKDGHDYWHQTYGAVTVVSRHPHDGACLVCCFWDDEEDEERFVTAGSEDLSKGLPTNAMTPTESEMVRVLRERGFAVVIFNPDELGDAYRGRVEDRLVELGWDVIRDLGGPGGPDEVGEDDDDDGDS
jgi:predicted RNA binding protein YcfA (HicA-like mRNA interferase family)